MEIQRLMGMLQGGRPIGAVRKDSRCSCEKMNDKLTSLSNEIKILELKKEELEQQVKGENKIQDLLQET
jgi:hypothetical protein